MAIVERVRQKKKAHRDKEGILPTDIKKKNT